MNTRASMPDLHMQGKAGECGCGAKKFRPGGVKPMPKPPSSTGPKGRKPKRRRY